MSVSDSPPPAQRGRLPPKSSHSVDSPPTPKDSDLAPVQSSSSPGKRNIAVTDLDQAMQDRDEERLRQLFGDQMILSSSTDHSYPTVYSAGPFGETDVDETNLDDPVDFKFVTNIQVQGQSRARNGSGGGHDEAGSFVDAEEPDQGRYNMPSVNLDDAVRYPMDMPPKLHFSHSEVFEGQLLLQWLASQFDSSHYLSLILTKHDIAVLMSQFCTHLLASGVLSQLQPGHNTLREPSFKPNGQYYWTKQETAPAQTELPGRLQPMWPPKLEDEIETRPGLKYTEADHQAAMVLIRKDYNQQVDKLQKEHAEELERLHADYRLRLEDLRAEVSRLTAEVEKYKQLAGIEHHAQTALSHAQAAQEEAGFADTNGQVASGTEDGKLIAVTGTPNSCQAVSSQSGAQTSSSAISQDDVEGSRDGLFWEDVEEAKLDLEEFDDLFSKVSVMPKKKTSANKPNKPKAKQPAKVVESKRSQAVGILLSTIRLEMSEIEYAILHLDTSLLDVEKFRAIYENRPADDEINKIKKHLEKHPDTPLDKPDQFLYDLTLIPSCADRIFCFIFQSTFQESMSVIDNKLNNLKMTCEMLTRGSTIKQIFGLILALGNYMNGGSRTRGQADGFELDILPKLKDYKAKDNRTSLMQYVVMVYVQRYEKDDAGTDKVKLPLPDPCGSVRPVLCPCFFEEGAGLQNVFRVAEKKSAAVLSAATDDNKEPFNSIMQAFFEKGRQDLADQEDSLKDASSRFHHTEQFFVVKPKQGDKEVTPEYFFSLWHAFCQDFKDHWKREQQRIVRLSLCVCLVMVSAN
nr:hypothetical protein BaRGS_023977 [Batillaria attramentaria]